MKLPIAASCGVLNSDRNKCSALNEKGHCTIYAVRPEVCKNYSHNACERYKGSEYIKETNIFTTEKEFL